MQVRVPGHERTVHPELARAALLGVRRHGGGPAADAVARLPATTPVPEPLHHALLTELVGHGWAAFTGAAEHLLDRPRESDVAAVVEQGALSELLARLPAIQLRYHVGHTTELDLDGDRLTVVHRALLGSVPGPAESLFTAAIHQVLVGACTGRRPPVTLLPTGGGSVPAERLAPGDHLAGIVLTGWRLDLRGHAVEPTPAAAVRDLIAADPARAWRLPAVAARLATSARSLQRLLAADGPGFQELVIRTRLGLARGLIERTDLNLAEIAAACGFTDHAHLTRCFTARHGTGPAALRRDSRAAG
ncbi:AraC family transcriptional regulator [Catellatospora sp. KI3]|uniref:helix-turn-helix transcriptional regulator n=1 Tax=Catellatospora sp. KI3 TaxID=3041620 RepID=UPI0024825922|nr:AraC family transcriptional regulator [Catellatospora sp. KI3]MDI1465388.1 AraC family transcriptional regulator [Catellatospora sp. KI3]